MALSGNRDSLDEFDALAEARRAARRAGMSLGEWLDAVVEGRGHGSAARPPASGEPDPTAESIAAIRARLDSFARRHDRREAEEPELRLSRDTLRRLEERLDEIARRTRTMPVEHAPSRTSHSGRESGAASRGRHDEPDRRNAARPSTELKDAIAEIAARQRALEQEFDQAMASYTDRLDHRIDRVAERVERSIEEASPQLAIRNLEEELRGLAARLENNRQPPATELHEEFAGLVQRLDELPPRLADDMVARLEETARRLDTATRADVDSIRAEMREIAQEIDAATRSGFEGLRGELSRLIAWLEERPAASAQGLDAGLDRQAAGEIAALRDDIRMLADQFDGAQRDGQAALRAELQQLVGRMDCRAPERLQELEHQLDKLFDRFGSATHDSGADGLGVIERQIAALAERFEATPDRLVELQRDLDRIAERLGEAPGETNHGELAEIERQIAALAERFEATPDRLIELQHNLDRIAARLADGPAQSDRGDLVEIERQIARLADRLEADAGSGSGIGGLERQLAELSRHLEETQLGQGNAEGLKGELEALKADIDQANERSLSTLNAVHDTLHKIVDRLNALEGEIEDVAASTRRPTAPPPAEGSRRHEPDRFSAVAAEEPEPDPDDIIERIETVTRSFHAEVDDHTPLAPGSAWPDFEGEQEEDAAARPTSREDFIAAARRAAQAAAAEQAVTQEEPDNRSAAAALLSRLRRYRLPLLAAAVVAALILGGLKLADMLASGAPEAPVAPAVEEGSAAPAEQPVGAAPASADEPAPAEDAAAERAIEAPRVIDRAPAAAPIVTGSADQSGAMASLAAPPAPVEPAETVAVADPSQGIARAAPDIELPPEQIGSESLRYAAAEGDPAAQYEVAARYTDGRGVAQDLAKAAYWYRLAAAQGLAPAQYRLGSLYEKGHGVPRDLTMARSWYQRAAERGNRTAMHNLAVLFAEGADGEADYEQAALWFRQSAEYGLKDSQYNLAVLYARGLGVEQNLTESYRWFAAAADQSDAEAASQRDQMARRLDPDALAEANLAAQSWQPKALIEEANRVPPPAEGRDEVPHTPIEPDDVVRQAQALLDQLGYEPGPVDGQAGALTRRAVIEFQRAAGLPETGEVTRELLDELSREAG